MSRKFSGEWEAKNKKGQPFASKKALKEYVAVGGVVLLRDLSFYNPCDLSASDELVEGEEVYVIYGPNPSRGVPNKWYANLKFVKGKLVVT